VDNVARVRDAFRAFGERDSITVGRLIGNGVVWRVPGRSAMAGEYRGRAEIFEFLRRAAEPTGGLSDGRCRRLGR
jgi:ketosteroid isomerase-like protein